MNSHIVRGCRQEKMFGYNKKFLRSDANNEIYTLEMRKLFVGNFVSILARYFQLSSPRRDPRRYRGVRGWYTPGCVKKLL